MVPASKQRWPRLVIVGVVVAATGVALYYFAWARNPFRFTALVTAAKAGDAPRVSEQIARGAELNRRTSTFGADNFTGWTALMWAAHGKHAATLRVLIDAGADTTVRDRFGRTALHLVFDGEGSGSAAPCVSALLSGGADPKSVNSAGETPLHNAVLSADIQSIKLLIDAGANVNALTAEGSPVLSYAIFNRKDVDIVRLLLEHGANVAQPLPNGKRLDQVIDESDVDPAIIKAVEDARK